MTRPDGTEKRRERTKMLGLCADISKGDAEQSPVRQIALARGQAGPLADNPMFTEVWVRYRTLKEPTWSTANRKAVVSVFEGASEKKKRAGITAMIGGRRVAELTRDPLQECLHQMAARGDSFSAVKKARTYITAALDFALDENLIVESGPKAGTPKPALAEAVRAVPFAGRGTKASFGRRRGFVSGTAHHKPVHRLRLACAGIVCVLRVDEIEPGILRIDEP